ELVDFTPQPPVRKRRLVTGFTFPDQRQLVLSPCFYMTVKCVVSDVGFCADEPLVKRRFAAIQHLIPRGKPIEFLRLLCPETFQIRLSLCVECLIILNNCVALHVLRRVIPFSSWR